MKTSTGSIAAVFSVLLLSQSLPVQAEEPKPAAATEPGEARKEEPKATSAETMMPEWHKKTARQKAGTVKKDVAKKAVESTKVPSVPETEAPE